MNVNSSLFAAKDAKHVLVSMNPASGSTNRKLLVDELATELQHRGFTVEVIDDIEFLCDRASQLTNSRQLRTVVSAGGDGTASLLVNRLPPEVCLTVFPMGTANLLAKFLHASLDVQKTVETISSGRMIKLDAGKANEKLFLVVASCGFDADVVDRIHAARKGHISYWSYSFPIVNSILKYRFPKMRFVADGIPLDSARWAFVLNVPQYALDLKFIDTANARDGRLDVCTFKDGGFFRGLFYFFAVLFRRHKSISATQFSSFKELTIESDDEVPIELDGDPGGYLPVEISVVPQRLSVLVPEDWSDTKA